VTDDYLKQYAVLRPFVEVMADRRAAAVKEPKAALVAYEDLSEGRKELNRDFARDIRHKLATVGYFMRPARTDDRVIGWFSGDEVEFLAEQEHERWMRQKLEQEPPWRWGPEDDDAKRESSSLVPWRPLSPEQKVERYGAYAERVGDRVLSDEAKDWDRFLVRSIPRILAVAGYTIVKHTGEDGGPS
jgi:hypothetical protein